MTDDPRPQEPLLLAENLHVHRGSNHVLQGVSLAVGAEPVAVVGRNGMGKTTLCEAIMGLLPTTRGRLLFRGQEIANTAPYRIVGRGVGYVPQGRRLFPSLTVREHLQLIQGRSPSSDGWTAERVYDLFPSLADRTHAHGDQLSGGEQQMLAIARALLINPRLLLLDEPSEGLAPVVVDKLMDVIRQLTDEGIGILLVEQNLRVATELGTRIAVMVNGRIVEELSASALLEDVDRQQRYLGLGEAVPADE